MNIKSEGGKLPLTIQGNPKKDDTPLYLPLSTKSAQVHCALTLARLSKATRLSAKKPMRDHTFYMLDALTTGVRRLQGLHTETLILPKELRLQGGTLKIPLDVSAAAFFAALSAIHGDSHIALPAIGINESRLGFFRLLSRMGARLAIRGEGLKNGGEPIGTLTCFQGSRLNAIDIKGDEAADSIDELVILCLVAAFAKGTTRLRGAKELRAKESDRLSMIAKSLRAFSVSVVEYEDGLDIVGERGRVLKAPKAPLCNDHDHRIAMMQAIAALFSDAPTTLLCAESAAVSFPLFYESLRRLGARLEWLA